MSGTWRVSSESSRHSECLVARALDASSFDVHDERAWIVCIRLIQRMYHLVLAMLRPKTILSPTRPSQATMIGRVGYLNAKRWMIGWKQRRSTVHHEPQP